MPCPKKAIQKDGQMIQGDLAVKILSAVLVMLIEKAELFNGMTIFHPAFVGNMTTKLLAEVSAYDLDRRVNMFVELFKGIC